MTDKTDKKETTSGQHILVTGAGTGIGRAIAQRLAADGAQLSLLARDTGRLEETAARITSAGGTAPYFASCDIRDGAGVQAAFAAAVEARGPLHGLVANSGIGGANHPGPDDRFVELVGTNLIGTYNCMRAAIDGLAEGPGARSLVVISSILGRIGVPGYTGYCASKAGLLGLVRSFAAELAPEGIRVNAICPGWIDTEMAHDGLKDMAQGMGISVEEALENAMSVVPEGHMGNPEDVAGCVAYLLSDSARGICGQAIDMNGGSFML